jgi:hypothetical protein
MWADNLHYLNDDSEERYCQRCYDRYTVECASCNDRERTDDMSHYGDDYYCEGCFNESYFHCHHCGNADSFEDGVEDEETGRWYCSNCRPGDRSRCTPHGLTFEFPALCTEAKSVKSEDQIEITTGGGEISEVGLTIIRDKIYEVTSNKKLRSHGVYIPELVDGTIDGTWQTKEGNFPKRVAKLLLVERQMKLTDELMAEIGNIAKAYTGKQAVHRVGFTRDLNQPREEFCNDDSCWWTDYWYSRCRLKQMHGMAVRTFDEDGDPISRAWLAPVKIKPMLDRYGDPISGQKVLEPVEALPADGYVLFNAYGMEALPFARLIAQMTGKSYRKIALTIDGAYVNNNHGVLIAEQSDCAQISEWYLPTGGGRCGCR